MFVGPRAVLAALCPASMAFHNTQLAGTQEAKTAPRALNPDVTRKSLLLFIEQEKAIRGLQL